MELKSGGVSVFVFGDLVVDHLVHVKPKERPFQKAGNEEVCESNATITMAGGAANCARALVALTTSRISLWGLTGRSQYGPFVDILNQSSNRDGASYHVTFHGSHDESRAMNTITRIVTPDLEEPGRAIRKMRIDSIPYIEATKIHTMDAIGRLRSENYNSNIRAIIINDLDMGAITQQLVNGLGQFAKQNKIPIFVDPKREWKQKYENIEVTCVIPNLEEWCHIIGEPKKTEAWRAGLNDTSNLKDMAIRSLRAMPNAKYHIIKCDKDGAVLICPNNSDHTIFHYPAHPAGSSNPLLSQLGLGDVMVAVLSLQFEPSSQSDLETKSLLESFVDASAVVASFRENDWHRIPNARIIKDFNRVTLTPKKQASITNELLYLPNTNSGSMHVHLSECRLCGSDLVSVDTTYKACIDKLIAYFRDGWARSHLMSGILTGRGGTGKTSIIDLLKRELASDKLELYDYGKVERELTHEELWARIEEFTKTLTTEYKGLLVVMDEAFSGMNIFGRSQGKILLHEGEDKTPPVRFLFIDADFQEHKDSLSGSQFLSRCELFIIPSIDKRANDIPYIFASLYFRVAKDKGHSISSVRMSESVLLAVIKRLLRTPAHEQSPRLLENWCNDIIGKGLNQKNLKCIDDRNMPSEFSSFFGDLRGGKEITFHIN